MNNLLTPTFRKAYLKEVHDAVFDRLHALTTQELKALSLEDFSNVVSGVVEMVRPIRYVFGFIWEGSGCALAPSCRPH